MRLFTTGRAAYRAKRMSMSENSVSRSEIDVGAALDAVEVATFEADELLNRVLMRTRLPTDRRIEAFQDAAGILHHNYHAMRFVRRAFERRREWPDPSELQTTNLAPLADTLEDIEEAKSHLGLAFFIFEAATDPSHWSNIIEPGKYAAAFERVSTALEKVKLAIESLSHIEGRLDKQKDPRR
jgi:hypothetical protein